jgi:hypothetical protein
MVIRILCVVVVLAVSAAAAQSPPPPFKGLPCPPYPLAAAEKREGGTVTVQVVFDNKGRATKCDVFSYSGPELLAESTRNFILGHWESPGLASRVVMIPIMYSPRGGGFSEFSPAPPSFLQPGESAKKLTLRAFFDSSGRPSRVTILHSSGAKDVDEQSAEWIKAYWMRPDLAGKTVDLPLIFEPSKK